MRGFGFRGKKKRNIFCRLFQLPPFLLLASLKEKNTKRASSLTIRLTVKLRWRGRSRPRGVRKKSPKEPTPACEPVATTVVSSLPLAASAAVAAGTSWSRLRRLAACAACAVCVFVGCRGGEKEVGRGAQKVGRDGYFKGRSWLVLSLFYFVPWLNCARRPLLIRAPLCSLSLSHLGGPRGPEASCQQRDTWLQRRRRRTGGGGGFPRWRGLSPKPRGLMQTTFFSISFFLPREVLKAKKCGAPKPMFESSRSCFRISEAQGEKIKGRDRRRDFEFEERKNSRDGVGKENDLLAFFSLSLYRQPLLLLSLSPLSLPSVSSLLSSARAPFLFFF